MSDSVKLARLVKSVGPVSELEPDGVDHAKVKLFKVDAELLATVIVCVRGVEASIWGRNVRAPGVRVIGC